MSDCGSFSTRIVLLGKSGSGKSSLGNTLLGKDVFEVKPSLAPVTQTCMRGITFKKDRKIEVIDTPGLFDSCNPVREVARHIGEVVSLTSPGPHVILYVIRADRRFTEEDHYDYNAFLRFFGEDVKSHTVLVFTGDRLLMDFDDEIKTHPDNLQEMITDCEGRYVQLDTYAKSNPDQVSRLFDTIWTVKSANMDEYLPMDTGNETDLRLRLSEMLNGLDEDIQKQQHGRRKRSPYSNGKAEAPNEGRFKARKGGYGDELYLQQADFSN